MGELKYRAEISSNGISEGVKIIKSQAERIESMLRELKSMAEYAEKIEDENAKLKKELEDQRKEYEKKLADAAKQQK
ncbi:MAG: hypothetical protein NT170_03915 [Candidatus Moranbacteria bacterium]|nr:hypothetical protein [Candidatus Moranbacteria bacterium]